METGNLPDERRRGAPSKGVSLCEEREARNNMQLTRSCKQLATASAQMKGESGRC